MPTVPLTDRQADIVEWLMGTPHIARWNDAPVEGQSEDPRVGLDKPEYDEDAQTFSFPDDEDAMWAVIDRQMGDIVRFPEFPGLVRSEGKKDAARGLERAANNLIDKIESELGGDD